jgi:CHAD domain-containing protein
MPLLLTPRHIVTKMEENTKRVDNKVDDYIKDSNENNIHDIRTAVRRLDASYRSLPKNIRRKTKLANT